MAAASNGGSAGLAVWPVSGSVTVSASPPAVVAMTGDVPAAYASRGMRPNGSAREGTTTSARTGWSNRPRMPAERGVQGDVEVPGVHPVGEVALVGGGWRPVGDGGQDGAVSGARRY